MYGVPADLDLSIFVEAELQQICIGAWDLQFHFNVGGGDISSYGGWLLLDPQGVVVDRRQENSERAEYRIHRLLMKKVVSTRLDPPRSFDLVFEDGHVLRFVDDSEQFETLTIYPAGVII